ncbi:MAG: flagellar hook-length control protein FliK [Nitrospirae bacterium]|nr:flagellar hook-length control protein FliK [Nitrospirota bacterium]
MKITPRSDYYSHYKPSAAKPKFDSIVRDEHLKAAGNKSRKEDIHYESRMKQDDRLKADDSACSQCSADVENRMKEIRQDQDRQRIEDAETQSRDTKDAETVTESDNGLKVGALLKELINKYAAGEAVTESGNGLKIGALLNELINKYAAGEAGTGTDSENGLKIGALLNELINKYAAGTEGGPELNELINIESAGEGKNPNSKDGLKIGHLLNKLFNLSGSSDQVKEDVSALSADQAIKVKAESNVSKADTPLLKKEMIAQAELINEALRQMNNVQSNKAGDLNVQEKNIVAEGLNNKLMSGLSDQFNNGHSPRNDSFNLAKSLYNSGHDSAANNINLLNNTNTSSDAAGSIKHTLSVNAAKTPAFRELLDNVVYVIKDNNKMGVTVEHDNFGKLNINLSMDKGMVNVHINTSDNVVREFLENNIQHIIDSLNKDGVSVGEFSIALKDRRENEGDDFSFNNGQVNEHLHETQKDLPGSGLVNIFA